MLQVKIMESHQILQTQLEYRMVPNLYLYMVKVIGKVGCSEQGAGAGFNLWHVQSALLIAALNEPTRL